MITLSWLGKPWSNFWPVCFSYFLTSPQPTHPSPQAPLHSIDLLRINCAITCHLQVASICLLFFYQPFSLLLIHLLPVMWSICNPATLESSCKWWWLLLLLFLVVVVVVVFSLYAATSLHLFLLPCLCRGRICSNWILQFLFCCSYGFIIPLKTEVFTGCELVDKLLEF